MTSTDWAAWVQAIGSIVAIGIAIAVPWWQTRLARQDQQEDRAKRASALALLFYPELIDLRAHISAMRSNLFVFEGEPITGNTLVPAALPRTPHLLAHIHDAVLFDKETAQSYHRLVFQISEYSRSHEAAKEDLSRKYEKREWAHQYWAHWNKYLRGALDSLEVVADDLLSRIKQNHVANVQEIQEMLTRREPLPKETRR